MRPHVPWYVRWAIVLPFVMAAGWLVWRAYDSGLEFAGFNRGQAERELGRLHDEVTILKTENVKLSAQAASFERQAQIEHAANLETGKQLKGLNEENARLQEDLAFLQSMTLPGRREAELSIHRLQIRRDALPGEYRFHMLLVQGGQQRAREFQGNLQLLVNAQQDGRRIVMVFPQEDAAKDVAYRLNFKYYQRIEHGFRLPPDMSVQSVQVRVFERGASEPKIKQDANLT